jgi:hypothetical protein
LKHSDTPGPGMPSADHLETLRSRPCQSKTPKVTAGTTFRRSGDIEANFAARSGTGSNSELGTGGGYVKISERPGSERKFWRLRF